MPATSVTPASGEAARRHLALFDFDGTITTRATFADFMRFAAPPERWRNGRVLLAPLVVGYRLRLVSGHAIRARALRFGFRDLAPELVYEAGRRYAREVVPTLLRAQALEKIRWHQACGDTVAVVSGALDAYLAPWCAEHGLDLLCSQLETAQGRLTGSYLGAQCVSAEKARRIRERYRLADYAAIHAYGDTDEDRAMLALADHRFFRWRELR